MSSREGKPDLSPETIRLVRASFGRCCVHHDFLHRFYELFIKEHDEVAEVFKHTNFDRQVAILKHGLVNAIMFAEGSTMAVAVLDRIRRSHSRQGMNIRPAWYRYWIESLVRTVREVDPNYKPLLGQQWRQVLRPAIDYIIAGYQEYD